MNSLAQNLALKQVNKLKKGFELKEDLKLINEMYEKVANVVLPFSIPHNFPLPRIMIYNAVLEMKNNEIVQLNLLYGKDEVEIELDEDKLKVTIEENEFNLKIRPNPIISIRYISENKNKL